MKTLLKVMLTIAAVFASTFILGRVFGILTEENVRAWLGIANTLSATTVMALVAALLFLDLFVAVPTLTIVILGGYFLGFELGFLAAMTGSAHAAFVGYAICTRWGDAALAKVIRDSGRRADMRDAFDAHGPGMILLARGAPILPEVTACMAGITRMPLGRFALFWTIGTGPYMAVAAYAGSVSTFDDPKPAIYATLGLYAIMWIGWFVYRRSYARRDADARV
jgi:uncharacterized membrane protein YdjX (TVP38/TMEM64 family)